MIQPLVSKQQFRVSARTRIRSLDEIQTGNAPTEVVFEIEPVDEPGPGRTVSCDRPVPELTAAIRLRRHGAVVVSVDLASSGWEDDAIKRALNEFSLPCAYPPLWSNAIAVAPQRPHDVAIKRRPSDFRFGLAFGFGA